MTEDKMVGWHHHLDGHEFEQVPGAGDGQGGLAEVHKVAKSRTRLGGCTEMHVGITELSCCTARMNPAF